MVVAQLANQSPPAPEIRGSNPVISKFNLLSTVKQTKLKKHKIIKKMTGSAIFEKVAHYSKCSYTSFYHFQIGSKSQQIFGLGLQVTCHKSISQIAQSCHTGGGGVGVADRRTMEESLGAKIGLPTPPFSFEFSFAEDFRPRLLVEMNSIIQVRS